MNSGLFKKSCLAVFVGIMVLPLSGYAYDTVTHEALTGEVADFFNVFSGLKLTQEERELMMRGSIEEDAPSRRVLNHFYDPVRNIGLNDGHSAKKWATSKATQEYSTAGGGNYSWPQIINDYAEGNEERAFRGLGHILHLIQDMATPDHTRNDSHLKIEILGVTIDLFTNPSPYEEWATQKTKDAIENLGEDLFAPEVELYTFSNVEEAFDTMAGYANGNFFSKDTIAGDKYGNFVYENPKITEFDEGYGYGVDSIYGDKLKLIKREEQLDGKELLILSKRGDFSVLEGYFDRLSKQAVIVGAGVVDLFFREAETARNRYVRAQAIQQEEEMRQNEELQRKLESANIFERIALGFKYAFIDPVASSTQRIAQWTRDGVVTAIHMDVQFQTNKYALTRFTKNLLANLASTFARETAQEAKQTLRESRVYIQERITGVASKLIATVSRDQQIGNRNKNNTVSLRDIESQIALLQEEIDAVRRARDAEQIGIQVEHSVQAATPISTLLPSPSPTPLPDTIDLRSFSGQFSNSLPEPQPNRAPEPVPNRAPEPASHPAETATPSPSPEPEEITQSSPNPSPSPAITTEPVSSPDPEDSETPTPTAEPSPDPSPSESPTPSPEPPPDLEPRFAARDIVINEIAWMGTRRENSQDEWIELFNTTSEAIDLTGWVIELPEGALTIEFTDTYRASVKNAPWTEAHAPTIPPFGYFLIERTDDMTTSEPAHWFFKGSLPNAKNSAEEGTTKEGLVLRYQDREIDTVSRWYAGTTDGGYKTMERISAFEEGNVSENWNNNDGVIINGMSAGNEAHPPTPILGTPGKENSALLPAAV